METPTRLCESCRKAESQLLLPNSTLGDVEWLCRNCAADRGLLCAVCDRLTSIGCRTCAGCPAVVCPDCLRNWTAFMPVRQSSTGTQGQPRFYCRTCTVNAVSSHYRRRRTFCPRPSCLDDHSE